MNIIIEGYLKRFTEEFDLNSKEKDLNFEKFCHYSILKNELTYFDDNDLDEIGIGKNKGIDGICISIDGNLIKNLMEIDDLKSTRRNFDVTIYFFQAKTSAKFEDNELANFCDTVIDFLNENPKYSLTKKAKEYHEIYLEILKLLSFIKSFDCKLFYCSCGTWDDKSSCATTINIKREQLQKIGHFKNGLTDIQPIDNEKIRRLYDKANQPLNSEFTFSQKTTLRDIPNVKESYLGVLPFNEYQKIIIDQETKKLKPLFYDNVRDFLGPEEEVNINISKTLLEKQFTLFQLLNNGITIIAEKNEGSGDKFILVNSQVVNGCQTSNVLFLNKDLEGISDLFIPLKLIITDDPEIRDKIIISTNSQIEIKEEQLLALTSFQKGLEDFYKHMGDGLFYERRKAQYSYDPSIMKKSIVDIREQIKSYVATFLEEPHVVSGYFGKVYRDRVGVIFNKEHKFDSYYLSSFIQYKFKNLINTKKIDRKYNKARYHIFMLFRKIAEPSEKLNPGDKKINSYCESIIKIVRDEKNFLKYLNNAIDIVDSSGINIDDQKEIYKKSTTNTLLETFKKTYH